MDLHAHATSIPDIDAMSEIATRDPTPASLRADIGSETLIARARTLCASGRLQAARPLLAAARAIGGPSEAIDLLEAGLLLRLDAIAEAMSLLDGAIARDPASAALRHGRARARLLADDAAGAARDAAEAVLAAPDDAGARATLGIALGELGRLDAAVTCLAEAVSAEPDTPGFRVALARAFEVAGDPAEAARVLGDGIAREPGDLGLRNAAVRLAIVRGDCDGAVDLCLAARAAGVMDACLIGMQGHALSCLGRHADAADAYEDALRLAPEDRYVRHLVAANGRLPPAARAPDDYVRVVFDGYAARFDAHLIALGYRVPGLLRAAALTHAPWPADSEERLGPVLDLGCGTGLAAVAMSDLPLGPWVGIDLSAAMLREAAAKQLYAELRLGSLPEALGPEAEWGRHPPFALAVAADLLCYAGDLRPTLAAAAGRLRPGGLILASVETDAGVEGWGLRPTGRYAHGPDHVRASAEAAGLVVRELRPDSLRAEQGAPVAGLIAVLARPGRFA